MQAILPCDISFRVPAEAAHRVTLLVAKIMKGYTIDPYGNFLKIGTSSVERTGKIASKKRVKTYVDALPSPQKAPSPPAREDHESTPTPIREPLNSGEEEDYEGSIWEYDLDGERVYVNVQTEQDEIPFAEEEREPASQPAKENPQPPKLPPTKHLRKNKTRNWTEPVVKTVSNAKCKAPHFDTTEYYNKYELPNMPAPPKLERTPDLGRHQAAKEAYEQLHGGHLELGHLNFALTAENLGRYHKSILDHIDANRDSNRHVANYEEILESVEWYDAEDTNSVVRTLILLYILLAAVPTRGKHAPLMLYRQFKLSEFDSAFAKGHGLDYVFDKTKVRPILGFNLNDLLNDLKV